MKEKSVYQVVTGAKSAPVGIDWRMIRIAREVVQKQEDSQKRSQEDSHEDKIKK